MRLIPACIEVDGVSIGADCSLLLDKRAWPIVRWQVEFPVKSVGPEWLFERWRTGRPLSVVVHSGRGEEYRGEVVVNRDPLGPKLPEDEWVTLDGQGELARFPAGNGS